MAEYYVDPTATGNDDGTTQTDAWTSLQRAIDGTNGTQPVAGDSVRCRGTETVSARTDSDGNSGDLTSGYIDYIGVNSSWVEDGTPYTLDADNNSIDVINLVSDQIRWRNFRFTNTSGSGNDAVNVSGYAGCYDNEFINCDFDNCDDGFMTGPAGSRRTSFYRCRFYDNRGYGIVNSGNINEFIFSWCSFYNNGSGGVFAENTYNVRYIARNCLFVNNTGNGIKTGTEQSFFFNCIFHGNSLNGVEATFYTKFIGCRITDNAVGIDSDAVVSLFHTYMPDTGEDFANTAKFTGLLDQLSLAGVNTNNLSGTDTNAGYNGEATNDFNLVSSASIREVAVDLLVGS